MDILFINSCVRENSRTKLLAEHLLEKLKGNITCVDLGESDVCALKGESLCQRDNFADETIDFKYAKQFASADTIVIAAPFWDYSFPALLKDYIERINVLNVTFKYENDYPVGLCKAKELYYISTSGGKFFPDYGYNYIKRLANEFYGIEKTYCIYAENLDIVGADTNKILEDTFGQINAMFQ